jgi:hypothetical protein
MRSGCVGRRVRLGPVGGGEKEKAEGEVRLWAAGPVLTGAATSSGPAAKLFIEHLAASDEEGVSSLSQDRGQEVASAAR